MATFSGPGLDGTDGVNGPDAGSVAAQPKPPQGANGSNGNDANCSVWGNDPATNGGPAVSGQNGQAGDWGGSGTNGTDGTDGASNTIDAHLYSSTITLDFHGGNGGKGGNGGRGQDGQDGDSGDTEPGNLLGQGHSRLYTGQSHQPGECAQRKKRKCPEPHSISSWNLFECSVKKRIFSVKIRKKQGLRRGIKTP